MIYRKYKNFSNDIFRGTLLEELSQIRINNDDDGFNNFLRICRNTLDRFTPRNKKYIKGNNAPLGDYRIMKRSNLRNRYLKSRNEEDKAMICGTNKFMCISIKNNKMELLFKLKRNKCHRSSNILENGKANTFKQICQ